jgi:ELWxxDGT repeat protein
MNRTGPIVLSSLLLAGVGGGAAAERVDRGPFRGRELPPVQQVKDILTQQGPSFEYPFPLIEFVRLGDQVLFRAWDGIHGWELWTTDGTPEGTTLLADLCPGRCSSLPLELRRFEAFPGYVYLLAETGDHGMTLWRSDGTAAGTVLVADPVPGSERPPGKYFSFLTEFQGSIYFTAPDPAHGQELWRSDGLPGGVVELVADVRPGADGSWPSSLTVAGGLLFFTADDGLHGRELWKSDGTAAGTELVLDLRPGPEDGLDWEQSAALPSSRFLRPVGTDRVLFAGWSEQGGWYSDLWVSDGTTEGTLSLEVTISRFFVSPAADGAVLFSGGGAFDQELWRCDGTPEGTALVLDIHPAGSSGPSEVGATTSAVYFGAYDSIHGVELWRTDGTAEGTSLVADIRPGTAPALPPQLLPHLQDDTGDGLFFFFGDDGTTGAELWRTDGTEAGTFLVEDLFPGADGAFDPLFLPTFPTRLDGDLIFASFSPDNRYRIRSSDGSAGGVVLLSEPDGQASAIERFWPFHGNDLAAAEHGVVVRANDGGHGRELWSSDGTALHTRLLVDLCQPPCDDLGNFGPRYLTEVGERVFFVHGDDLETIALWASDGSSAGTHPVYPTAAWVGDLTPWTGGEPRLLFASDPDLLVTDGTPEGTVPLTPPGAGFSPASPTPAAGRVFFSLQAAGYVDRELWVSEGEEGDAVQVADIAPGALSSDPGHMTAFGGSVFFSADDGTSGREPWTSDGTAGNVVPLGDLRPGSAGSMRAGEAAGRPMALGGHVYFAADDGVAGEELWRTDLTPGGTAMVADLNPGPAPSDPRPWLVWKGQLFFSAYGDAHGRELWRTDGTPGGTFRIADIHPGPGSGISDLLVDPWSTRHPEPPVVWRDRLYFAATDGATGVELWSTDGSEAGTVQAADIHPGPGSSSPASFTTWGTQLFLTATDGVHGFELWTAGEPLPPDIVFADGFESGDTSAWGEVVP